MMRSGATGVAWKCGVLTALGALLFAFCPAIVSAATDSWIVGTGNWSVGGNWSSGVPGNGTTVNFVESDGTSRTITYDYAGTAVTLGILTIDQTGTGSPTNTLSMSANTLSAAAEVVGNSGNAAITQSGGNNNNSGLTLGNNAASNGFYSLSGSGSLTTTGGIIGEVIGYSGTGTFTQSGGSSSLSSNSLVIGLMSSALGTYTLSGGSLMVNSQSEYVGSSATGTSTQSGGTVTQSGGTNTINGGASLYVGYNANSTGFYSLSGSGSLSISGSEYVGYSAAGTSTLSGGTFAQSGGTNTTSGAGTLFIGYNPGSNGIYNLSSTGSLSINGHEYVGSSGTGTFNQTGGTNILTGTDLDVVIGLNTSSVGTYNLSGAGSLSAGGYW